MTKPMPAKCPRCKGKGMVETGNSIHLGRGQWIHRMDFCPECGPKDRPEKRVAILKVGR